MGAEFTVEFAKTQWQPFTEGSPIWKLIVTHDSVKEDFTGNEKNWFSEKGIKYDAAHMDSLWKMIESRKRVNAAKWMVHQGIAPALNPALAMLP